MGVDVSIAVEKFSEEKGWEFIGWDNDIMGNEEGLKRNYVLYCILANSKEDYDILDDTTTASFISIAEPRGIPNDADKSQQYATIPYKKDPYGWWYPSWVTLKEILDYPHWDKQVLWKETSNDKGVKISYREKCKEFLNEFVPKLKQLTDDPENLRIVYHFW